MNNLLKKAISFYHNKEIDKAEKVCVDILEMQPNNFDATSLLGVIYFQNKDYKKSIRFFNKALEINSNSPNLYNNLAIALLHINKPREAIISWDKATKTKPDYAEAFFNKGNVYSDLKDYPNAIENYELAIKKKENYKQAYNNLGSLYAELKNFNKALEIFKKATSIEPPNENEYNNLGNIYFELKEFDKSIKNYNLAIKINPNFALGYYNIAKVFEEINKKEDAVLNYNKAISLKKNFYAAYKNLGNIFMDLKILDKAIYYHQKALEINPNISFLSGTILQSKCGLADWKNFKEELDLLEKDILNEKKTTSPFPTILMFDSPSLQKKVANIFNKSEFPKLEKFEKKNIVQNKKIRLAYYSSDFHNHATMYLMAKLFELHDKTKFETFAFSFGPDDKSKIRNRVIKSFDKFIDVRFKTSSEIVNISRELNIDIAVDLKGYTNNNRFELFIKRCAPIQISYLGFPGTTGSSCIDYLIADKVLIPDEYKIHYSENIIYLPNTYQVNDFTLKISDKTFSKNDFGLPEDSFVFCCFNHNYKILPDMFEIWIRILERVQNSVLWLLNENDIVRNNLKGLLSLNGIDNKRIIFAGRVPHPEHLARLKFADLFLDTFPCNAHTTASDALRANLPIITLQGQSFAGRVASSLLTSIGLEQLITVSKKDYEELGVKFGKDKNFCEEIRKKIKTNIQSGPLFNTKLFTKNLESAYFKVYEDKIKNKKPKSFEIN